ncbi:substrate-binding domain-containing protein [Enterococcus cecorum]
MNERQIPCPEQVRIIGFGNVEVGNYMTPKLSTVELNASQMGTYGAILIQSIMNDQQNTPVNIITGTKLLIKET